MSDHYNAKKDIKNPPDFTTIGQKVITNTVLILNILLNSQTVLAQNSPSQEMPRLSSQQEQIQEMNEEKPTFKTDPNFPFLVKDLDYYGDGRLRPIPSISTNIPQNPNPNFNLLLQKILTSSKTYDDGGGLSLKYDNVFGVANQKLFLGVRLKLDKNKNGNSERVVSRGLDLEFRSNDQPGKREGNFGIVFQKDGTAYISLINIDSQVTETLKAIFGEKETAEILKKAEKDSLRRYYLSPEQQQKLIEAIG